MRRGCALLLFWGLLLGGLPLSAADGMFQGKVIDPPVNEPLKPGWIYVQGRNHMLRRVEVAHAVIVFSEGLLPAQHGKCRIECLAAGQEVRITADQDANGEWRAKRVEILRLTSRRT